jgi:hypothetical protein
MKRVAIAFSTARTTKRKHPIVLENIVGHHSPQVSSDRCPLVILVRITLSADRNNLHTGQTAWVIDIREITDTGYICTRAFV